jgi:hypothetical protein
VSADKTLGRIAALLRQAEGTDNAHEAEAFMEAAQRLATTASIDLAVARAHTAEREKRLQPVQRTIAIGEPGTKGLRTYVALFLAIAHANDVTCDIARNSSTVYCYGFDGDIGSCEALYASLAVQMVRASDAYIKTGAYRSEIVRRQVTVRDEWGVHRRWADTPVRATTARINFQQAFAVRIGNRLREASQVAQAAAVAAETADAANQPGHTPAAAQTGTELVLREKALELRDFYKANSRARGTWQGARAQAGYSSHARMAGDRAGRAARLGGERAIGGSRRSLEPGDGIAT